MLKFFSYIIATLLCSALHRILRHALVHHSYVPLCSISYSTWLYIQRSNWVHVVNACLLYVDSFSFYVQTGSLVISGMGQVTLYVHPSGHLPYASEITYYLQTMWSVNLATWMPNFRSLLMATWMVKLNWFVNVFWQMIDLIRDDGLGKSPSIPQWQNINNLKWHREF